MTVAGKRSIAFGWQTVLGPILQQKECGLATREKSVKSFGTSGCCGFRCVRSEKTFDKKGKNHRGGVDSLLGD